MKRSLMGTERSPSGYGGTGHLVVDVAVLCEEGAVVGGYNRGEGLIITGCLLWTGNGPVIGSR